MRRSRKYNLAIVKSVSSPLCYLLAWLWQIQQGKNNKYWGMSKFFKTPGSVFSIGSNCEFRSSINSNMFGINHPCFLSTHCEEAKLIIGNNCGFSGVVIGAADSILIGNNVYCGANSIITDFDWHSLNPYDRDNENKVSHSEVIIGNRVWIGANSMILKGVTVGENTVIGSNSLVLHSLPPNVIAGGNPARVLKNLIY